MDNPLRTCDPPLSRTPGGDLQPTAKGGAGGAAGGARHEGPPQEETYSAGDPPPPGRRPSSGDLPLHMQEDIFFVANPIPSPHLFLMSSSPRLAHFCTSPQTLEPLNSQTRPALFLRRFAPVCAPVCLQPIPAAAAGRCRCLRPLPAAALATPRPALPTIMTGQTLSTYFP